MATDQEKANLRAIEISGVSRMTTSPTGETSTEFRPLAELRGIRSDLDAEDLAAQGKRRVSTILIATSKGIC